MVKSKQPTSNATKSKTIKPHSINDILSKTWKDSNAKPLPYAPETMSKAVSKFGPNKVEQIYKKFRNNTIGGKKSKRITITPFNILNADYLI